MPTKFRPLQDRLLVKRSEAATETPSGLIIPDAAKEKPSEGTVLAIGPGRVTERGTIIPPSAKVGDRVLFSKYGGSEIQVDGEALFILREDDILGVFVEDAPAAPLPPRPL